MWYLSRQIFDLDIENLKKVKRKNTEGDWREERI